MKLRKLKTKKTIKEKINIALFTIFFVFTLSLTVGYAAINQNFKISGEATFKPTKDCGIINVELLETSNMGLENYKSTYTTNTVSLGVDLKQLNSTITYKVTVYNSGTLAMWIDSIVQEVNNNTNMEYVLNGIGIHELINPGEIKEFNITIKYKNGVSLPSNTNLDTKLKFNFINPVSTLAPNVDFVIGPSASLFNGIYREEVESITFVPTIDVGEDAIGFWDASEEGNGTVIAWATDKNNNGLYEVMVGGIGGVYAPTWSIALFAFLPNVTSIDFNGYFFTPNAETMELMFAANYQLKSLNMGSFDVSNSQDMYGMFYDCYELKTLNISNFDAINVGNITDIFSNCYSLETLNISNFNAPKVTDMSYMFSNCESLTNLDLSGFNTDNVTNMSYMFLNCELLTNLDLSKFKTNKVTDMSYMFSGCNSITSLDVSKFDTFNVTNMTQMFDGCKKLANLNMNINNFTTTKVTNMERMFRNCELLTKLDLSGFNTANVTNMKQMFDGCKKLSNLNININNFTTAKVTNMFAMFRNCELLTKLDLSKFNTAYVTSFASMFQNCSSLETLNVSNFGMAGFSATGDTLSKDTSSMFEGCSKLKDVKMFFIHTNNAKNMFKDCGSLANVNFRFKSNKASDMSGMFQNCKSLTRVDEVFGSNIGQLFPTELSHMFDNCVKLESIDISTIGSSDVLNSSYMFNNCSSLISVIFPPQLLGNTNYMFANCTKLEKISEDFFIPNYSGEPLDASYMFYNCKEMYRDITIYSESGTMLNMSHMFDGCESIKNIYFYCNGPQSLFATNTSYMFNNCKSLEGNYSIDEKNKTISFSFDITSLETYYVEDMSYMFAGCTNIIGLDLTKFNTDNVTNMSHMFDGAGIYLEALVTGPINGLSVLSSLTFVTWDVSNVTNMSYMFANCPNLNSAPLVRWQFENLTNYDGMFKNSLKLEVVGVPSKWENLMKLILSQSGSSAKVETLDI